MTLIVVVSSLLMFVGTFIAVVWQLISSQQGRTFRLRSTRREPEIMLPPDCSFCLFVSHTWATGQDQAHTIVRQLQLLLPGIPIWLDVDCMVT